MTPGARRCCRASRQVSTNALPLPPLASKVAQALAFQRVAGFCSTPRIRRGLRVGSPAAGFVPWPFHRSQPTNSRHGTRCRGYQLRALMMGRASHWKYLHATSKEIRGNCEVSVRAQGKLDAYPGRSKMGAQIGRTEDSPVRRQVPNLKARVNLVQI